jgi:hypothetical protein
VSIENIALERYFYDGRDESASTEQWLQNLEGEVSGDDGPYQTIIESGEIDTDILSGREIIQLGVYVAVQELRTRKWRNNIKDTVSQLEDLIGEEATTDLREDMVEFQEDETLRSFQSEFLREKAPEFANTLLDRMEWLVLENETDTPIWTSDDPVVRYNSRDRGGRGSLGLQSEGIEIYFPLSPNHMLYLIDREEYREERLLMPNVIDDTEQIIFFNDLQAQGSERHIFSADDDFQLAERRLEETPEVGDPDRERTEVRSGLPADEESS